MAESSKRKRRPRGSIGKLHTGALRVRVYAGWDPVTKRRHYLDEVVPPGPKAEAQAEAARVRLVNQVNERRNPRTAATVEQLLTRYLSELRVARKTLHTYRGYVDRHVLPFLGAQKVGQVDADVLDSLYAELQRCRDHCDGRGRRVDHRTTRQHECDERCTPHECRPLAESTVRKIHWILSGAFRRAQRWKWIAANPMELAEPPAARPANPKPPTAEEAAQIVNTAWRDPDWGTLVWLTMVTGHRRGELCAIRWRHVDLDGGLLHLERRIGQIGAVVWEDERTKTYTDRRVVLDPETVNVVRDHRQRIEDRADALGVELSPDSFVFSLDPDGARPRRPDSVTQRYRRMCDSLGIDTTIHKLRHYSATELILAGVDVRTVAGRLGHGGGGATTLRTYAAWVSEGDQRAAAEIAARMPSRPTPAQLKPVNIDPKSPYERIAVSLRDQILDGTWKQGEPIPTIKELAARYSVANATVARAVTLLAEWGFVDISPGRRTLVRHIATDTAAPSADTAEDEQLDNDPVDAPPARQPELLDLELRRHDTSVSRFNAMADPDDGPGLHKLFVDAITRNGGDPTEIGTYELIVRRPQNQDELLRFVASAM